MQKIPLGWFDLALAVLVLLAAAALRFGYLAATCPDPLQPAPVQVQDPESAITLTRSSEQLPTGRNVLVDNLRYHNAFADKGPLSDFDEETARLAPGYPWLVARIAGWVDDGNAATRLIRWLQCGLGAMAGLCYYFFARLTFNSRFVGLLAGLLTAINPFWIANVVELQDGTLVSFLVAACLCLGTMAAQRGNVLGSLLFGVSLAAMSLVRAALLPFAFLACLWFLLRCRSLPRGWVCALLAFLGFANGVAPWMVRNLQTFGDVIPISNALYLDLWIGSNSLSRGGPQNEETLRQSLPPERLKLLLAQPNQARRYGMLAEDYWGTVRYDPASVLDKRLRAGVCYLFGEAWVERYAGLAREQWTSEQPEVLRGMMAPALSLSLIAMLSLGLLGWRWSHGWNREASLASLALLWIPLPYVLTHADSFSGPRLPLDGVLLTFTAFALAWIFPPVARVIFPKEEPLEEEV
jgi:hypothetical protein